MICSEGSPQSETGRRDSKDVQGGKPETQSLKKLKDRRFWGW